MFAATFALTNCTKNDEANNVPVLNGPKYELFAEPADTRTALGDDGVSTMWLESDSINVFHAVAGSTTYKNDGDFDFDAATSGRFTGTLAEELTEGTEYDWYLFYPYNSFITTPDNDNGRTYIGKRSDQSQVQNGNDSRAHICGTNCPLYGKATVKYPETLKVQMNHIASVIAVKVTNDDANDIVVKSVSFTAPESIVGEYYINFAGESPVITDYKYTSATANLTVTNGAAITAEGGSATFYMLVKPFTAAAGDKLSLSVTTDQGTCTKSLTLPNDVAFTAGKIKTLNIGFTAPNEKDFTWNLTINETKTATEDEMSWENDIASMVVDKGEATTKTNNYYPGNGKSSTRFYKNSVLTITPKDGYIIKRVEFNATASTTSTAQKYATALNNSTWTNATSAVNSQLVTITPTDGATAVQATISDTCGFSEVVIFYEEGTVTPTITAENIVDVAAVGVTDATATITLKGLDGVAVNATPDGTVVTAASVEGNTLKYTVSKNESFEAREGKITLSAEGADDVTITVSQLAKEAVTLTLSKDAVELEATDEESHEDITFTSNTTTVTAKVYNDEARTTECTWITAHVNGKAISYLAEANTGAERVAYIVVTATLDGRTTSESVKVTQKTGLIGNPTNIKVTKVDATSLTATWDAVEHAKEYEWEIKTKDAVLCATGSVTSAALNFDINNLDDVTLLEDGFTKFVADTEYVLYVKSIAADGYTNADAGKFAQSDAFKYSESGAAEEKTAKFTFNQEAGSGNATITRTSGDITCVIAKGSGSNNPNEGSTYVRFQAKNTMTISGGTITNIAITFSSSTYNKTISANVGTYTKSSKTATWTGSATEVVLTNTDSSQARISSIVVTYK